jgi:hypothetical protein
MMECWKNGIMGWRPSGRYTPAAKRGKLGSYKAGKPGEHLFTLPHRFISLFHHSIIPVWNMQDGCWGFLIINNL